MLWRYAPMLTHAPNPLVVDLGYGRSSITTIELAKRLGRLNPTLQVIGLEIDPDRVRAAQDHASSIATFALGGFEIPTDRAPTLIRAFNVLRQYPEEHVEQHWKVMQERLAGHGRIVEGTCDEPGRLASWVELDERGPLSLTLAADLTRLSTPSDVAPRLPKILIHHNVDGEPIHRFFRDIDAAWASHAALRIFGARQRWAATVRSLRGRWPVITPPSRDKRGEITIAWDAVSRREFRV